MRITFHGHACFSVFCHDVEFLIDPFISKNPMTELGVNSLHPDVILVTHGHQDHLGDALEIAMRCGAILATQVDLLNNLDTSHIQAVGFNLGGSVLLKGVQVTMTPAWHGSSIRGKKGAHYAGVACGYILHEGDRRLYHSGDTALFGDMQTVLSRYNLDCALLPIGDFYTMGPDDAAVAAQWLGAKTVVPMHYNTFSHIKQDPAYFASKVEANGQRCVVMKPGDSLTI